YKLDDQLLPLAVEQKPLPAGAQLTLILFPGQRDAAVQALSGMDAVVVAEDRSPFGPQLRVRPATTSLVSIAQLPVVQAIELYHRRALLNDLGRERVRVSTNTVTSANYRDLDGTGIIININDTGVDEGHPALSGRVTADSPFTLTDPD